MHFYGYYTNNENKSVSKVDVILFKPVCKKVNLPGQHPISVSLLKRISVTDSLTGKIIDYRSSNDNDVSFSAVSVRSWSHHMCSVQILMALCI